MDLGGWTGVAGPARRAIDGRYVRLEPLAPSHAATLYEAATAPGAADRFRWLFETPPSNPGEFDCWIERAAASTDPLFFAVVDKATGRAEGRQALMRIDTAHGVIEVGNIMWGPALQRTRMATEALYLFADYVFGLGYRRFEWKCNDLNVPSKRAAVRFGFLPEGVFRQHMVVKGASRDTAWFAMTDGDWRRLQPIYAAWLSPDNFDAEGRQRQALQT
ncbi:MAG: N-acetyltransferase [Geminicoccaceae bacterium]|nr:MAG: N-acetyltransferase [Geminicoccaceae bacterium]